MIENLKKEMYYIAFVTSPAVPNPTSVSVPSPVEITQETQMHVKVSSFSARCTVQDVSTLPFLHY